MYRTVPSSRSARVADAWARLLLLATLLLMLIGQASLILGVALPGWERAAILLDTLGVGLAVVLRLLAPRPVRSRGAAR